MNPQRPFDGIRVLDVTTTTAGAIAAMYIADFGGDVVKVDPTEGSRSPADPTALYADRNKSVTCLTVTGRDGLRTPSPARSPGRRDRGRQSIVVPERIRAGCHHPAGRQLATGTSVDAGPRPRWPRQLVAC